MTERVIEVRGLRKSYGDVEAVRGIDLHVDRGEVFALLGPNGAGKTTTVEILEGFRGRTDGEVSVLGHDPARHEEALKRRIGIVLQSTGVDPYLTVRETVEMYSGYYPAPRASRRGDRPRRARREAGHDGWSSSPAASSDGSTWRSRSPATPSCCSSTSRRRGSTRARGATAWEIVRNLAGARQDGVPHHALHGRGAVPRRPGGGHRAR